MRRRSKDPKKSQEVFLFALEALQPPVQKPVHFGAIAGVHDEVFIDLETIDLSKKPGLITAQGISAIANNQGSNVLTKKMLHDMVELFKKSPAKQPDYWVVSTEAAKDILKEIMNGEVEWDSNVSSLDV